MTRRAPLHRLLATGLLVLAACTSEPDVSPGADGSPVPSDEPPAETQPAGPHAGAFDAAAYRGLTYPPVPDSLQKRGGALAQAPGQEAAITEHAFADVFDGDAHLLWLSVLRGRDADGEATWEVVDAVEVPEVGPNARFLISGCRTPGRTAVAAIVEESDRETLTTVHHAWGVDRAAGRLVTVDTTGVECENEGLRAP